MSSPSAAILGGYVVTGTCCRLGGSQGFSYYNWSKSLCDAKIVQERGEPCPRVPPRNQTTRGQSCPRSFGCGYAALSFLRLFAVGILPAREGLWSWKSAWPRRGLDPDAADSAWSLIFAGDWRYSKQPWRRNVGDPTATSGWSGRETIRRSEENEIKIHHR